LNFFTDRFESKKLAFINRKMSQTKIANCKVKYIRPKYNTLKDWMDDAQNVYVGRAGVVFIDGQRFPKNASPFANPFKVIEKDCDRETAIDKYKTYIQDKLKKSPELKDLLLSYKGKTLGCWCHPEPCHADVLIAYITEMSSKN
jgi:hypothetical protein